MKIKVIDGIQTLVCFKELNGVEFIRCQHDVATMKKLFSSIEGRKVGVQIWQKTNKEMQKFIDTVSLLQSNYQLIIVKSLLERTESSRNELITFLKTYNPKNEFKEIGVFDVLLRKGFIKKNSDGKKYQINSDLSEQNRERLAKLAESRLGGHK